ncbi:hypothetical protein [Nostoc sp. TCL240-02]|uniref:hypothetical protein n=1 Tax=Nostoc sp. TCL240-02 TaxID=2572090 RepID=UPI00157F8410|nr:hypothetical protein [Nostoc sp. TCL240-02]QKQ75580.1 hypothetical protein FBB35_21865 [Nostoc sp. TCL240-02]
MSQPITLYSPDGDRTREIAAIDAPGWIQAGWSTSPVVVAAIPAKVALEPEVVTVPEQSQTKSKRNNDVPRDGVSEN